MKKTSGQGQGSSKPSEVRNSALVPVNNTNNKPKTVKAKTAEISSNEEAEFDYKSLGKISSGYVPPKKSFSFKSSKSGKGSSKKGKFGKLPPYAPAIALVAAFILVVGAVFAVLSYTGVFDEKVQVTLADGTVKKIPTEQVYAELMTDKFYSGIVIDGIDVGGMTYDEAFNAISSKLPAQPETIDIRLSLEGKTLFLDFSDATFEYNTRQILDEAFAMYRPAADADETAIVECYNNVQQERTKNI